MWSTGAQNCLQDWRFPGCRRRPLFAMMRTETGNFFVQTFCVLRRRKTLRFVPRETIVRKKEDKSPGRPFFKPRFFILNASCPGDVSPVDDGLCDGRTPRGAPALIRVLVFLSHERPRSSRLVSLDEGWLCRLPTALVSIKVWCSR